MHTFYCLFWVKQNLVQSCRYKEKNERNYLLISPETKVVASKIHSAHVSCRIACMLLAFLAGWKKLLGLNLESLFVPCVISYQRHKGNAHRACQ